MRSFLSLAALLLALIAPARAADGTPPIGKWDRRGRYISPLRRENFRRLHRGTPIPRHPVVLVHGIAGWRRARLGPFFADYFNGIRSDLEARGIPVLVTRSNDFDAIETRAAQVKAQILEAMEERGWQKVNLIAHSMGGLDCRYLITHLGMGDRVASLTSVSSPHHGSWYADFAIEWVFEKQRFRKVWDFLGIPFGAVPQMTTGYVNEVFNPSTPDDPRVRYFSFSGRQPIYKMPPPLSGMGLVMTLMGKRLAGKRWGLKDRAAAALVLPKALRRALKRRPQTLLRGDGGWVKPGLAGKNDGIIPTSSAMWGEHLVTLDADHFDQLGWLGTFNQLRFFRNICRMLVDAGL